MSNDVLNAVLSWFANRKRSLIQGFYISFLIYFALITVCGYLIARQINDLMPAVIWMGTNSGKLAVAAFLLTTSPGILGRFKFKHPLITLGMMFRRQTGLASFFLALGHASLLYIIPKVVGRLSLLEFLWFEVFGAIALVLLTLLCATSNDLARAKLGGLWKRLHQLVYFIYWLIFLHLILNKVDLLAVVVGASAVLEVGSLIFAARTKVAAKSVLS